MTSDTPPSPAWLGVGAAVSFLGLVVAAFASGHHLVDSQSDRPATSAAASAAVARHGTVREEAGAAGAGLRAAPDNPTVAARLPAKQRVEVLEQQAEWLKVRAEVGGTALEGWTEASNVALE